MKILHGTIRSAAHGLMVVLSLTASVAAAEAIPAERTGEGPISSAAVPTVLTLEEAARLLRVDASELAELARERQVPSRKIGEEWRFSREALLAWLAGTDPWDPVDSARSPAAANDSTPTPGGHETRAESPMSEAELASIAGRGPEDGGGEDGEEEDAERESGERELTTAGEPPAAKTADEIFLRRTRLLLDRGQFIVEPWLSYSRGEDELIRGFQLDLGGFGTLTVPQMFRRKQETTSVALGLRYGLFDQTELYAGGRYRYRNVTERSYSDQSTDDLRGDPEGSNHMGRALMGVRHSLFAEDALLPDVVLFVEGGVPISKSSYFVGAGLSIVRSFDPISLFAGLEYRHIFSRRFEDLSLLEPENLFGASVGYAFSVNDELTLSTSVSALFTDETDFGYELVPQSDDTYLARELIMKSDDSYQLRLGLTYMFREGIYVEPNLTFDLTDPGSWMMLGVSVPMTFD